MLRLVAMAAVASLATATQAAVIYVDFSDTFLHPGGEQTTPVTRQWNIAALNTGIINLVDEGNISTSVDLVVVDNFDQNGGAGKVSSGLVNWGDPVTNDSWVIGPSPNIDDFGQLRLEGLIAGELYDLTFYGARGIGGAFRIMMVTIDGGSQIYASSEEGLTVFSGLAADGSGNITIDFSVPNNEFAQLSGMQIVGTFVPEPSSFLLATIGLSLVGFRRKR